MIENSGGIRIAEEFAFKSFIKADIIGGIQTIFAKRHPISTGNRPGLLITLRGNLIECMTFANNAKKWITTRTIRGVVEVGQKYEILVFRVRENMRIYVNGIDRTHPKYRVCSPGDLNSDMEVFLGAQLYDAPPLANQFVGRIYSVELYDQAYFSAASLVRFPRNPFAFPLSQLPEKKEQLKLPIKLERA